MRILMKLDTSNDAFVDQESHEVARILRELADRIDGHPHFSPGHEQCLRDANGNEVGFFDVLDD